MRTTARHTDTTRQEHSTQRIWRCARLQALRLIEPTTRSIWPSFVASVGAPLWSMMGASLFELELLFMGAEALRASRPVREQATGETQKFDVALSETVFPMAIF